MQLLVVAGGLGTRLRPVTLTRPKALVPLLNRPQILHLIDRLPDRIDQVLVAVNYMFDEVRDFFGSRDVGRDVVVVHETTPLGTGGAIKNVEDRLEGTFVAVNGDVIDRLDLEALVAFHEAHGTVGTLAVVPVDDPSSFGVVAVKGDLATKFVEKPPRADAPSNLINAGRYVFEPDVLDAIPKGREVSLEREVFPKLIDAGLAVYRYDGPWSDAGTLPSYLRAQAMLLVEGGAHVDPDADVARATIAPPVLVAGGSSVEGRLGPRVAVGRGCRIGRATIVDAALFDGVSVDDKAHVSGSLVGARAAVGEGAVVRDSILADGAQVPPHANLIEARVAS
ncbi:MAG TPA: NDP-sugar synthase [Thermoplasmata archaeon]|nr:NDP-sugar synthase [Thermoplasmata archaeon]